METFADGNRGRNIRPWWRHGVTRAGHPIFAYPLEVRRVIYTTNALESVNIEQRMLIKTARIISMMKRQRS